MTRFQLCGKKALAVLFGALLLCWGARVPVTRADEHPKGKEHPTDKGGEEHPKGVEHPKGKKTPGHEHPKGEEGHEHPEDGKQSSSKPLTKEALAEAIEDYVERDAELKGGYFVVYDEETEKPLVLELDRVHEERLARVGADVYFACADFKTTDGKSYDLDFFMEDGEEGIHVTDISVHKVDGKPRYTWIEENGIWKRKEVS